MHPTTRPIIDCDQQHACFVVSDIDAAVEFYLNKLGFSLTFTWGEPRSFAGVVLDKMQMFLQRGTPNPEGCSVSFVVSDVDALYQFHRDNGVDVKVPIGDREYGLRDYGVRDLHGYTLNFGQHLFTVGPAIEITRVDVPVRLESRLAALLTDLAEHKRMSVSSCLEETLLHTLDGVGPHTDSQLRYIQQLKAKHGIDYDSHGSYRFVEK